MIKYPAFLLRNEFSKLALECLPVIKNELNRPSLYKVNEQTEWMVIGTTGYLCKRYGDAGKVCVVA